MPAWWSHCSTVALALMSNIGVSAAPLPPRVFPASQIQAQSVQSHLLQTRPVGSTGAAAPPAGYNETYGYPDGVGGLIVEGPFPYKNGPPVWDSGKNVWGAYGLLDAAGHYGGSLRTDGTCDPVPPDSPFAGGAVQPVPLTNGLKSCLLGCNLTDVSTTGKDPCTIGSVADPTNSPMRCYDVGPGFAGGWGVCGYNCTAFHSDKDHPVPCTKEDIASCSIYCDTRTFPGPAK